MLSKISKGLARSVKSNQVSCPTPPNQSLTMHYSKSSAVQSEVLPIKTKKKTPWEDQTSIKISGKYLGLESQNNLKCIEFNPRSNIYSSQKHQLWATSVNCLSARSLNHLNMLDLSVSFTLSFSFLILIYYYRDDYSFQWNQSLHWENQPLNRNV
jgi:hypothetical protein